MKRLDRHFNSRFIKPKFETLESRKLLTTYYVDAELGNDSADGTSPQAAWATIAKASSAPIAAGDTVLLKRGVSWMEELRVTADGSLQAPIRIGAYGTGDAPQLHRLTIDGNHVHVSDVTVDRNKQSGDAVRIRFAHDVVLRDMEIRNGTSDGIDATDADGLLIDGLLIHHFLAGSFTNQADAHGIVLSDTQGATIRNTDIHQVSGDSFQADPDRDTNITTGILIESSHFWTAPLSQDFNDQWFAGQRPGENAIDTKMVTSGWDSVPAMKITVRDVVAHGWVADGYISNRAVFNMKEKIDATFDRVTVYDSEIGFRLRGGRGNADVKIQNAVMFDLLKAIRAEDNLENLTVYHSTFGDAIGTDLQFAGGSGGTASWDWQNNAILSPSLPAVANPATNSVATHADFVDAQADDYHLAATSPLVDAGNNQVGLPIDRENIARPQGPAVDIGAYERVSIAAAPPTVEQILVNGGEVQRSVVNQLTLQFDQVVRVDAGANPFLLVNETTGAVVDTTFQATTANQKTSLTLTFLAGDSTQERADGTTTLRDGDYTLTVNAAAIEGNGQLLDGDQDGQPGGNVVFGQTETDGFFRLYGDSDGDRDVDSQDLGRFLEDFRSSDPTSIFDYDGDGDVDSRDFSAFRRHSHRRI